MKFKDIPKFVINLERRPDRLESVQKEFNKFGLEVLRWPAIDGKYEDIPCESRKITEYNARGINACRLSHVNLIKYAKQQNYEYVAVFEDDIIICEDFWERIEYCEKNNYDILYLGGQFDKLGIDVISLKQKHIFKAINVGGTYAYVIRNTLYDFVIENCDCNWGMDEFYANMVQPNFDCILFYPLIIGHLDGMSDVSGHDFKCPNVFKHYQPKKIL